MKANPDAVIVRPESAQAPHEAVREIIERVVTGGDRALLDLTERFDKVRLESLRSTEDEIDRAYEEISADLKAAMHEAARRIRSFAEHQVIQPWEAEIGGGLMGEVVFAVPRAGCYVPGGRASYPSSVLMTAIPAGVAGVEEVALCVPPAADGTLATATLAAAKIAGVTEVYKVGGAHAIAALAYGTESIAKVDVIVGPGNIFVATAKQQVAGLVGIDSIAGPSEIAVVTDGESDPRLVALDLIAQAEHGPGGMSILVTWKEEALVYVAQELEIVLAEIGASDDLRRTMELGCVGIAVRDVEQAAECINRFAPEHLELLFAGAEDSYRMFRHAGVIFVGEDSPVPLGDYVAGSNHVLPTGGGARWASGLRTSHFQRACAVVRHNRESLWESAHHIEAFAQAEGLPNHSRAVKARFNEEIMLEQVE